MRKFIRRAGSSALALGLVVAMTPGAAFAQVDEEMENAAIACEQSEAQDDNNATACPDEELDGASEDSESDAVISEEAGTSQIEAISDSAKAATQATLTASSGANATTGKPYVSLQCSGASGTYTFLRSTSANGSYSTIGTSDTSRFFTDETGLEYGKTYYYKVSVRVGTYLPSGWQYSTVTSNTLAVETAPQTPTMTAQLTDKNAIKVSWTKCTGADGYYLWFVPHTGDNGDTFSYTNWPTSPTYTITGGSTTSKTFTNLAYADYYGIKVQAYHNFSLNGKTGVLKSLESNKQIMYTAPGKPTISASVNTDYQGAERVKVGWKLVTPTVSFYTDTKMGYNLQRSTDQKTWTTIQTVDHKTSVAYDTSFQRGKTYYYRVVPYVTNYNKVTTNGIASNVVKVYEPANGQSSSSATSQNGWRQSSGKWWYKIGSGYAVGWKKISGAWYYFDKSGWMKTGWVKDNSSWYYLNGSGAMQTGWIKDGGSWYYLNSSGVMQISKWIGNYYVQADGTMATNKWIGNYHVNSSGLWDNTR